MCGKEGFCPQCLFVRSILQNCARNAHPIVGRSSPADLIQNQQTPVGRIFYNIRHLGHFDHESRLPRSQIVRCPHTRKNAIYNANFCIGGRNKTTNLRHYYNQRNLAHIGRFTRHVWACNNRYTVFPFIQQDIIRHKRRIQQRLHHRVTAFL